MVIFTYASLKLFLVQDELGFASHHTFFVLFSFLFFLSFFLFLFVFFSSLFFNRPMDIMRSIYSKELVLLMRRKMVTDGALESDVLLLPSYLSYDMFGWVR